MNQDPPSTGPIESPAQPIHNEPAMVEGEPLKVTEPTVDEKLAFAQHEIQELKDAWLRAKAEADNLRKRAQIDIANAHKYAMENFADSLLPVKDSLETTLANEGASWETLKSGVELTLRQLNSAFEKSKIVEINPQDEKFDANRHQAMNMVESDRPANTVIQVFQKGYLLHDRVLRPALVAVAKNKSTTS